MRDGKAERRKYALNPGRSRHPFADACIKIARVIGGGWYVEDGREPKRLKEGWVHVEPVDADGTPRFEAGLKAP